MAHALTNKLTECRIAKGISKSQLAFRIKMSRGYVTRLERGDIQPSIEAALRIARCIGQPVEAIFQLTDKGHANTISRTPSATSEIH